MTSEEMRRAANILDAEAESLRRCNTDASGEWVLYYEGQADREAHDEMCALAAKLRAMADAAEISERMCKCVTEQQRRLCEKRNRCMVAVAQSEEE